MNRITCLIRTDKTDINTNILMRISVLLLGVLVLLHTDTNGGFILMLQVLLILLETGTSIVL